MTTKIEWCDETINPLVGCSHVSAGCNHCYAERMAVRMDRSFHVDSYAGLTSDGRWTGKTRFLPKQLERVLKWRKPRHVFWNSMGDTFHPNNSDNEISACFGVMAATPQHMHMVLTKRPRRALEWYERIERGGSPTNDCAIEADKHKVWSWPEELPPWPLPNVWVGVTAEDQDSADERIPKLLQIPAAKRFVSIEPMLSAIDLTNDKGAGGDWSWMTGENYDWADGIDWVIVGGESGSKARPIHPDWVRSVRDQCVGAGVPFFFKQWGEWYRVGKNGRELLVRVSWIVHLVGDADVGSDTMSLTNEQK